MGSINVHKKKMWLRMILTGGLLFTVTGLMARVFPVNSQQTLEQAARQAAGGDVLVIANGRYSPWQVTLAIKGTARKPVVVRAQTKGGVIFSGDVFEPVFKITGTNVVIKGLTFQACSVGKAAHGSGLLIGLQDAVGCRITHCNFSGNRALAQFMPLVVIGGAGRNNRVDHCIFSANRDNQELQVKITDQAVPMNSLIDHNLFCDKEPVSWKDHNGGECVQVGQDPVLLGLKAPMTTVRNNHFIHCNGEPEVISNKSSGNRYLHNSFEACAGELVMRGGHDCLIDHNIFHGGKGGIRINGSHHTVTHNAFHDVPTAIRLMYGMVRGREETGFYVAATDCVIRHNRIIGSRVGILIGDAKGVDWTGKIELKRYPTRTVQDVAPADNLVERNIFRKSERGVVLPFPKVTL